MKQRTAAVLIMIMRACWVLALVLGCLYVFAHTLPLVCHLLLGIFAILALLGLAVLGFQRTPLLATIGAAVGLCVPVLGLAQSSSSFSSAQLGIALMVLHSGCALAAIALAEILAKRIRLAAAASSR